MKLNIVCICTRLAVAEDRTLNARRALLMSHPLVIQPTFILLAVILVRLGGRGGLEMANRAPR